MEVELINFWSLNDMQNLILHTTQDKKIKVELYELGGSVYLSQDAIAKLFDTSRVNITTHIRNILKEGELRENSVCKNYLHTASDNKQYRVNTYKTLKALKEK